VGPFFFPHTLLVSQFAHSQIVYLFVHIFFLFGLCLIAMHCCHFADFVALPYRDTLLPLHFGVVVLPCSLPHLAIMPCFQSTLLRFCLAIVAPPLLPFYLLFYLVTLMFNLVASPPLLFFCLLQVPMASLETPIVAFPCCYFVLLLLFAYCVSLIGISTLPFSLVGFGFQNLKKQTTTN
jgi:hypothetical protein